VSVRAVIPARILRQWDARALEQLCERAARLEKENEDLRYLLTDAEHRAEFWSERLVRLQELQP